MRTKATKRPRAASPPPPPPSGRPPISNLTDARGEPCSTGTVALVKLDGRHADLNGVVGQICSSLQEREGHVHVIVWKMQGDQVEGKEHLSVHSSRVSMLDARALIKFSIRETWKSAKLSDVQIACLRLQEGGSADDAVTQDAVIAINAPGIDAPVRAVFASIAQRVHPSSIDATNVEVSECIYLTCRPRLVLWPTDKPPSPRWLIMRRG
jgi:hypothetical protein